jgi:hypothetical protein
LRFGVDKGQKQRKRKESFAKRNERLREEGRKSLKSLGAKSRDFAGLFVFNGLTAFLFRACHRVRSLDPKKLSPADRGRPFDKLRAGFRQA